MSNEAFKLKAKWDAKKTELFIKVCLDQVNKGLRKGTTLTKTGWKNVISEFNEKSGRHYDKGQFKNKWDNLRKEWLAWHKLFSEETGLEWDSTKNIVNASDEWWEKKQLENPQYGKFRYKELPFAQELTTLFDDVVATRKFGLAPSSSILPNDINDNHDVHRPSSDDGCVDLEEGSGDSDEIREGDVGASVKDSAELRDANVNNCLGNISEANGKGKRKRVEASDRSEGKNKMKVPASKKIADAYEARVNTLKVPGTSISEVMAELQKMEAITSDLDWHSRCSELLLSRAAREMFVALKPYEQHLLNWLKFAAYRI